MKKPNRKKKIKLYLDTARYLKPVQIYGRLWRYLYIKKPDLSNQGPKRLPIEPPTRPCSRPQTYIGNETFSFINQTHPIKTPSDWNKKDASHLWIYNLHYFDFLRSGISIETGEHWIQRWISENPPGLQSGWAPYPTALRITNWVFWDLHKKALHPTAMHALAVQMRFLKANIEYHQQANHLLVDFKGLYLAAAYFDGDEEERIRIFAAKGLICEIKKQIGDDGGHFELSPMYHGITTEDLLDVISIQKTFGLTEKSNWDQKLHATISKKMPKMLSWLNHMKHPDGEFVLFNDGGLNVSPCPDEILQYGARLEFKPKHDNNRVTWHNESGHLIVKHNDLALFTDVGQIGPDFAPGHAHADSLTFECSLFGKRFIVDTGTSEYAEGPTRTFQRSTAAHNTVEVDNSNSSEVWGAFRVARRARPGEVSVTEDRSTISITASHDGYKTILKGPTHKRIWEVTDNSLSVEDSLDGPFKTAVSRFHLHPDVQIIRLTTKIVDLKFQNRKIQLFLEGGKANIVPFDYSPEFGIKIKSNAITIQLTGPKISQRFSWKSD